MNNRYILALLAAAALLVAGCAKVNVAEDQDRVPDGEMAVRLGFEEPHFPATRSSYVSGVGAEGPVMSIAMLCFDNEGKYIGRRDAELEPDTDMKGTLTGTVPSSTCRIHFVANFLDADNHDVLDVSGFQMGFPESTMMKDASLSSGITDRVRYWGYHMETTSSKMKDWLTGGNTVKLLRDRAKVVLEKASTATGFNIVGWTIANGLNKGYVAPVVGTVANPYNNEYTSLSRVTEYAGPDAAKYTSISGDIWAVPTEADNKVQYLFENANILSDPVKVIIHVKYTDNVEKYHTVLLQNDKGRPYPVIRNQSFTITIVDLPETAGSTEFADALTTTNYSNNPYAQISREVETVSNGTYTLTVADSHPLFQSGTEGVVTFTYTAKGTGSIEGLTGADFDVSWESKPGTDQTPDAVKTVTEEDQSTHLAEPTVEFDDETGEGTIRFPLADITDVLKHNSLQIIAPSAISRFVDVYSITGFNYTEAPALNTTSSTMTVRNKTRKVYTLTFTLPSDLPDFKFPMKVNMYSSSLVPYGVNSQSSAPGTFNVVVAKTDHLNVPGGISSANWKWNGKSWNQYYEYVIPKKPASGAFTIYMYEIVEDYARDFDSVGLFFEIDGFGTPKELSKSYPN